MRELREDLLARVGVLLRLAGEVRRREAKEKVLGGLNPFRCRVRSGAFELNLSRLVGAGVRESDLLCFEYRGEALGTFPARPVIRLWGLGLEAKLLLREGGLHFSWGRHGRLRVLSRDKGVRRLRVVLEEELTLEDLCALV